eukprot:TRINITY_DN23064_c0_g1_i1.p1 TRINITY_DN23064_c0_g1~~TRINITY_DN23064_c0_g1_i1.p1  ORF type:complete len:329 (-),score=51.50 TRINITY_DN23064_c0_g1_i1:72-1025(-)
MRKLLFVALIVGVVSCACPQGSPRKVSSSSELKSALESASVSQPIEIQPGTYTGKFVIQGKFGMSAKCPIKIYGNGEKTVLNGEKTYPCLEVKNCGFIEISRMGMRSCDVGVAVESSIGVLMESLVIYDVHKMGVQIRKNSQKCQVGRSRIFNTGTTYNQWGYGVSIGKEVMESDDYKDSDSYDNSIDSSSGNVVVGNRFGPRVSAAGVVVWEGSSGGSVSANQFDMSNHWVNLRGNGVTVKGNIASPRTDSLLNEPQGVTIGYTSSGFGTGNTVSGNKFFVNGMADYAITVDNRVKSNQVCSNSVSGALKGVANVC